MELKVMLTTFALVFVAELGDKTQLATMLLAAQAKSPLSVFAGAGLALLASALLGVLLGTAMAHVLPMRYIKLGAGAMFVVIGLFLLLGRS